jgi:hypothetical protein
VARREAARRSSASGRDRHDLGETARRQGSFVVEAAECKDLAPVFLGLPRSTLRSQIVTTDLVLAVTTSTYADEPVCVGPSSCAVCLAMCSCWHLALAARVQPATPRSNPSSPIRCSAPERPRRVPVQLGLDRLEGIGAEGFRRYLDALARRRCPQRSTTRLGRGWSVGVG